MSALHFKLAFCPLQASVSESELRSHVTDCWKLLKQSVTQNSITIQNIDEDEFTNLMKVQGNKKSLPIYTEFEISISAKYKIPNQEFEAYESLLSCWMKLSRSFSKFPYRSEPFPILMFSDLKAFRRTSQSAHKNVPVGDVSLGILPFPCEFVNFVSLKKSSHQIINFFHDERTIEIPFYSGIYVLSFSYRNIRRIIVNIRSDTIVDLYLDLLHPPLLYQRETKRSGYIGTYKVNRQHLGISELTPFIIGRANVLKIELINSDLASKVISRLQFRCFNLSIYYSHITQSSNNKIYSCNANIPVCLSSFSCQYLLSAIFQRNFSAIEQCLRLPQSKLSELSKLNHVVKVEAIEKALCDIMFAIDSGKWIYFPYAFLTLSNYYNAHVESNDFAHYIVPEKSRMIRRVTMTPTRVLLWPPEIMFENRVLRNFDPDYALRVSFRNDDLSRLSWNALYIVEEIFEKAIRTHMLNGIQIGERNFKFLGWSNSQIRDHGVWYYACDKLCRDVSTIRKWMGDFSHIKSVPRYMARMGQAFSQTEDSVSVPLVSRYVRFENDIEAGYDYSSRKSYCFSDGVGKISCALADKVHKALGHDKHCSAFQIRYGGCKGMLTIDPTLKDADIVFRASMKKFESPQNTRLEIAKTSAPVPLQLNRPFITLLNQMGVPPRIFLQLQEEQLRELTDVLLDEEKAARYLKSKAILTTLKYEELSRSGIHLTTEPFFRSLLLSLHKYNIDKIKTHANISIDPALGRNMLGVLDETGTLEYGQVFVQYTKDILFGETNLHTIILTGTVLVTKNPCMHPGDVRKFVAVDVPALHHIIDCIVFPQKGPRPHPNEMAGSDMDGDEYAVLWQKELIFRKPNAAAANYPSFTAPEKAVITNRDMVDFLVEYIKNDQVGVIANAHLAHADKKGIHSPICLNIASKFSVAVDYAKNGAKRQLQVDERPTSFPDFMEKSYKVTYKSKKALGKLYRVCKDFEGTNLMESLKSPVVQVDPALICPGWEKYKDEAIRSRDKYNRLLSSIFQTYGVQHESEAFTGAFSRLHCRFQERKDRAEIEKVVIASISTLCKNMNNEFHSDLDSNVDDMITALNQKASAWYVVTYSDPNAQFLSFPWIVSNYLGNIKIKTLSSLVCNSRSPITDGIELQIDKNIHLTEPLSAEAIRELNLCVFLCDESIVQRALRMMMHWAWDWHIIQEAGARSRGFLFRDKFAKLFMHVAEKEKYVSKLKVVRDQLNEQRESSKSAAALCLAFLHFCMTLRFYNKYEVKQFLPFEIYKYKDLSRHAMYSYHDIAVTGSFHVLRFDVPYDENYVEMKAEYIESSVFKQSPISPERLQVVEKKLVELTGVQKVSLREIRNNNKVIVSAIGTEMSVNTLKSFLRKESSTLSSQLGFTGFVNFFDFDDLFNLDFFNEFDDDIDFDYFNDVEDTSDDVDVADIFGW